MPPRRPSQPRSVTRTSYHVGKPWMFDGKMLRGLTGTPMRRIDFANSSFADAEPEPLTLANLTTKSLTASIFALFHGHASSLLRLVAGGPGLRHFEQEFAHVPRAGRTAFGAQAAMQADVFILHHHAAGFQQIGNVQILREIQRRRGEMRAQRHLLVVAREGDAIHRTDVDAGIAFDADILAEHGFDIAIQATLRFGERGLRIEAEFDFDFYTFQRFLFFAPRHGVADVVGDVVVVAPLVDAHLLRDEARHRIGPLVDVFAVEHLVDGNGRIVAVRDGPDDVLRTERRVAAEEDFRMARLHRHLVDFRQTPFVEFDADVALDPRKRVFLADGDQHVVAFDEFVGLAGRNELRRPFASRSARTFSNVMPISLPSRCSNVFGTM